MIKRRKANTEQDTEMTREEFLRQIDAAKKGLEQALITVNSVRQVLPYLEGVGRYANAEYFVAASAKNMLGMLNEMFDVSTSLYGLVEALGDISRRGDALPDYELEASTDSRIIGESSDDESVS